ncbi:MAG: sulfate ABC transporter permease subunit CysT [Deltaproteobacteria bacterium]|nr:sulfate ABC transporter permease subunit CysT [Deltaproteobacteria bacterium]
MAAKRKRRVLPGFGLSLGFAATYLGLVVLLPLVALIVKAAEATPSEFFAAAFSERALASYRVSFGASLAAAAFNALFGPLLAWVLARYRFPGREAIDALVDLPFALPTAVAGITLTALLASTGLVGAQLAKLGVEVAYTKLGIAVALAFIGLPFVVRTVQPVLADLDKEWEEAAATLGAGRWRTFRSVLLPALWPAIATGFAMAFARGIGEYGSVVFISGNMPYETEIAPLLIVTQLEQYDYVGATAIAVVMLSASFTLLLAMNALQRRLGAAKAQEVHA